METPWRLTLSILLQATRFHRVTNVGQLRTSAKSREEFECQSCGLLLDGNSALDGSRYQRVCGSALVLGEVEIRKLSLEPRLGGVGAEVGGID